MVFRKLRIWDGIARAGSTDKPSAPRDQPPQAHGSDPRLPRAHLPQLGTELRGTGAFARALGSRNMRTIMLCW